MGTETRIGIATGLVIVVVASVYFFYGSDRSDSDLLMVSSTRLDEVSAVPPGVATKNNNAARRSAVKPSTPKANKPKARAGRPTTKLRNPGNRARPKVAKHRAAPPANPRARGLGTASEVAARPLTAGGTKVAAAHRKPPTRLRSEPSSILIDATKKNLEQSPTTGKPKTGVPKRAPGAKPAKTGAKRPGSKPGARSAARRPGVGAPKAKPTAKPRTPAGKSPKRALKPAPRSVPKKPVAVWPRRHTIVAGDTLSGISSRYYGTSNSVGRILKANARVKNPRNLKIGQVLVIPAPRQPAKAKATKAHPAAKPVKPAAQPAPRPVKPDGPAVRTYRVRPGDSFYTIAKKMYRRPGRWKDIYTANRALVKNDPKRLRPGMVLRIPK